MEKEKISKEEILNYVSKNWKKVPYLCRLSQTQIDELVEKSEVNISPLEFFAVSRRSDREGSFYVLNSLIFGVGDYGEDNCFLTSQMELEKDGRLHGTLFGKTNLSFDVDSNGEVTYHTSKATPIIAHLLQNKENKPIRIVTHFGDDLDNKSSIEALEQFAKLLGILEPDERFAIERVPAGQIKEGCLNVDTGGHKGNIIDSETNTIVIDGDPKNGIKSAAQSLMDTFGIYVPEQILELADTMPQRIDPLDSRTGLALVRYLEPSKLFELAEERLLDVSLTDTKLEEYGLVEAHKKQQEIIDVAKSKIEKYTKQLPNGEQIVLSTEKITGGAMIVYAMGIPYYASIDEHFDKDGNPDGITFAISSKPDTKLPDSILKFGRELSRRFRDEATGRSDVFVHPNNTLIVAGGPKNPDFKLRCSIDSMAEKIESVFGEAKQKNNAASF